MICGGDCLEGVVGRNVGAGDDGLDDGLAVRALALARDLEGLDGLLEAVPVRDERLEVDLALAHERDRELVVAGLFGGR